MTHTATIAIAPLLTLERVNDPWWNQRDRWLYDNGALRLLPTRDVPLLVDHDDERVIGSVRALDRIEWHDGGGWIYATATVDKPPPWLKRNTPASFGCLTPRLRSATFGGHENVVAWALVDEVSVLSSQRSPQEPHARVLSFQPVEDPKAPDVGGTVIWGNGRNGQRELIRRQYTPPNITVRDGRGQVIVNRSDGSQVIFANEREYQADLRGVR